jgi:hypothetical protein
MYRNCIAIEKRDIRETEVEQTAWIWSGFIVLQFLSLGNGVAVF